MNAVENIQAQDKTLFPGKLIELDYEGRTIEAIVIDPNGLGEGKPTIGMGFRMTERHMGIPQSTLTDWGLTNDSGQLQPIDTQGIETDRNIVSVSPPSGNRYSIYPVTDEQNREQLVIEASDWMELAADVLETPGKVRRSTQVKIIRFLKWFAVKGFYANCYAILKGAYTASDDTAVSRLMVENEALKAELEQAEIELVLTSHRLDQVLYERDELQEIAHFNRHNCWEAEVEYLDDDNDEEAPIIEADADVLNEWQVNKDDALSFDDIIF